ANQDLWMRLDAAMSQGARIKWRYVPGHAGYAGNDRADEIASEFALGHEPALYSGPYDVYGRDLTHMPEEGAPMRARAAKSRTKSTAHSYVSVVDGVAE